MMRRVFGLACPVLSAVALLLPACETARPTPTSAEIEIVVSPLPVVVRLACPEAVPGQPPPAQCLVSLSPVVTIRETGGVGGRLERVEIVLRNLGTGQDETRLTLGRDWIVAQARTDRIEAGGSLAFQPVIADYPVPYGAPLNRALVLSVRFLDDNGNVFDESVQINITS